MSCYIRHMKGFLEEVDIKPETKEDRKKVDLAIREVIGKGRGDKCNEVWREVKLWLQDEEKKNELADKLRN